MKVIEKFTHIFWAIIFYCRVIWNVIISGLITQLIITFLVVVIFGFINPVQISGEQIRLPYSVTVKYLLDFVHRQNIIPVEDALQNHCSGYHYLSLKLYKTLADRLTNNTFKKISFGYFFLSFLGYLFWSLNQYVLNVKPRILSRKKQPEKRTGEKLPIQQMPPKTLSPNQNLIEKPLSTQLRPTISKPSVNIPRQNGPPPQPPRVNKPTEVIPKQVEKPEENDFYDLFK